MAARRLVILSLFLLALLSLTPLILAQAENLCPQLVETAMAQLANNCANGEQGSTCYGFPNVQTQFMADADLSVVEAGDSADNLMLQSITGSPFDVNEQQWGISINNVEANLPAALPGPGGVFITLGDVRLENGVMPADAVVLPDAAVAVTVGATGTDVYSAPPNYPLESTVVGTVPAGTVLEADALSDDGQWLRVYFMYEREFGTRADAWVAIDAVNDTLDPNTLPVFGADDFTPMQKFYLDNADDTQPCAEATPSMLYVQGPDEVEMDFIVNGAEIRLSSTAMVRVLGNNTLQVMALSGVVQLNPRSPSRVVVPAGFSSYICLNPTMQNLGVDGQANDRQVGPDCTWSEPAILPAAFVNGIYTALNSRIPTSLQYYALTPPRLSCPSGVGGVRCRLLIGRALAQIQRLCRLGRLPRVLCDQLLP